MKRKTRTYHGYVSPGSFIDKHSGLDRRLEKEQNEWMQKHSKEKKLLPHEELEQGLKKLTRPLRSRKILESGWYGGKKG